MFESAEALLSSPRIAEIHCLVVDFQMPGLDGLELQRRLRETEHPAPVILISARDTEVRERALREGAVAVFGKPFSADELLSTIQAAVPL